MNNCQPILLSYFCDVWAHNLLIAQTQTSNHTLHNIMTTASIIDKIDAAASISKAPADILTSHDFGRLKHESHHNGKNVSSRLTQRQISSKKIILSPWQHHSKRQIGKPNVSKQRRVRRRRDQRIGIV